MYLFILTVQKQKRKEKEVIIIFMLLQNYSKLLLQKKAYVKKKIRPKFKNRRPYE